MKKIFLLFSFLVLFVFGCIETTEELDIDKNIDSTKPVILELQNEIKYGEDIVIKGLNLSLEGLTVSLCDEDDLSYILEMTINSDSELVLKNTLNLGTYNISLIRDEYISKVIYFEIVKDYSMLTPVINEVLDANNGEYIVIKGMDFDTDNLTVLVSGEIVNVKSSNTTEIVLDNNYEAGLYKIQVKNKGELSNIIEFEVKEIEEILTPVISEVLDVNEGEDIIIKGYNFDIENLIVLVSGEAVSPAFANTTEIILSNNYLVGTYDVQVKNKKKLSETLEFEVKENEEILIPVINFVYNVDVGEDIIIKGYNFDVKNLIVLVSGEEIIPIFANTTEIILSNNYVAGTYDIQVKNKNKLSEKVEFEVNELMLIPVISSVLDVNEGENIVIIGRSFDVENLTVLVSGELVIPISLNTTKIVLDNNYEAGTYDVQVKNKNKLSEKVEFEVKELILIPVISSVLDVNVGENIVIIGYNFDIENLTVLIAGKVVSPKSINMTEIVLSNNYALGTYKVQVKNKDEFSNSLEFDVLEVTEVPVISSVLDVYEGEDIVIRGRNFDIFDLQVIVAGKIVNPKSANTTQIVLNNNYAIGIYKIQVKSKDELSNIVEFSVIKSILFPEIISIFDVNEGEDIVIRGMNFDVANLTVLLEGKVVNPKSSNTTQIVLNNNYAAGTYKVQVGNKEKLSNIVEFDVNELMLIPEISSILDVNEGEDIVIIGRNFDVANLTVLLEGKAVNPKLSNTTQIVLNNNYAAGTYKVQVGNKEKLSNEVEFMVKKIILTPVISSVKDINEGEDIVINGYNFDSENITVFISGTLLSNIISISSTKIVVSTNMSAGIYIAKVFNDEVSSNEVSFEIKEENPIIKYIINTSKCVGCSRCVSVCPVNAIYMSGRKAIIDTTRCIGCGKCVNVCGPNAISQDK